jgi:hypothetical protein
MGMLRRFESPSSPAGSREIRISPIEGTYSQWSANGRAIFYISNRDLIVSVAPVIRRGSDRR